MAGWRWLQIKHHPNNFQTEIFEGNITRPNDTYYSNSVIHSFCPNELTLLFVYLRITIKLYDKTDFFLGMIFQDRTQISN